ncbi:MAG: hypothetical protein H0T46_15140 [Deltaproteobacteria bacterium]|nr:hypothetical protein [Deltaproteobacteria bacterium]
MSRVIALLLVLAGTAAAAPGDRVLLADPDPELLHAVEVALAPWKLSVVVDQAPPKDDRIAHERADVTQARFVVWRKGDELVVFDRERDASERRPVRRGKFDAVSAAAAAATVKTMMRLPPPPPEDSGSIGIVTPPPPPPPPPSVPPPGAGGIEVRLEAGIAARIATGDESGTGGRAVFAAMLRPTSAIDLRFGVRADLGATNETVKKGNFEGRWSDWSVVAAASYTLSRGMWELEPWLAGGFTWGSLEGTEQMMSRSESATMFTMRGGTVLRRRYGLLTSGVGVELSGTPGAPNYLRVGGGMGSPDVYQASKFSVVIGGVLAIDLGR